jgi:hypothetical protein
MAANPWEMNWQAEQAPSQQGGMPWQMNWKEDKKPIDFSIPTEEALRTSSVKEQPITRSYADEFKRQAGLTARYLTEGIVGTGDILTSPIRTLGNAILPESLQAKPLAQVLTRNLPQPETTMERMVAGPSRVLASTLGTGGIGTLARPVSQLGKTIQQAFTANAPTQAAAATGGGLGQAATQELGGGAVAQTLAGLGGGLAGAGLVRPKAIGLSTQQLQNANRDETLKLGRDAGYVALPTDVGGSKIGRFLEGVSGKFKTEELASARNQQVTNNLTKRYLDLPEDTPLTSEVLENARTSVYPAYEAIAETGVINLGNKNPFSNIVTGINKVAGGKNALMQDIPDTYNMDAATAIQKLKELRSDGSAYLRSGTNIMKPNPKEVARGNRYLAEANKLEKAIENHVVKLGQPELIDQFRNARRYIAKTFTVEKALNPQTGVVDARKIAKQLDQGAPITDELALVGKYAKAFPKTTKVVAEAPAPFSVLDFYGAGAGGFVDLLTGVPALSLLAPARIGARYGLMTPQAQQMLATPQYTPRTAPFVPYQGLLNIQE